MFRDPDFISLTPEERLAFLAFVTQHDTKDHLGLDQARAVKLFQVLEGKGFISVL